MTNFERLLAQFDSRSDRRGREFERVCQWLLRTAPEYRTQLRHVWLWDEWPGRWAADAGIDLVAEAVTGELWAIQAKAYDPAYSIKKADVDSFLSESGRPEFQYRLLVATTDRIGQTARRTLAGQEKPAGVLLRSQLAVAEVAWPASPADLRPRPQIKKRPRPHQRKAVAAVVRGFRSTDRGQLVMACGTGKTLAACFLAESLEARRVLVLVPSLSLLAQSLREWGLAAKFAYLAVCSDATVTRDQTDAVVASTSELGFPVTTDPAVIARFLRGRDHGMRVVFATYQSSPRIAEAHVGRTPAFDLVIADEAHRCAGPQAGVFATVLDQAKIKARKRLFMTATPRYYTERLRKEASEADWEIASMDDETQFGPVLHRLTFAQAIQQDLLSDYQVVVVGVSDTTFKEMAQRAAFVTADGETITDARTLASQLGLLRAMRNHDLQRVVSFHSRIRSAREFATSLPDVSRWMPSRRRPNGTLWTQHVSGEMTSGEREVRLNQLREIGSGERGVLTNARCLSEGVDVPTLDGVAFIEPRRSQVDIVQAVGRALRKADDKTLGTIVIPVFVDESADPEQALDSSEFDRVWRVVKALRAHDDVLAHELDELRRERGRRRKTSVRRPEKIVLDLPVGVGAAFARAFDTRVVEHSTSRWEEGIGHAEAFLEANGHLNVPVGFVTETGFRLGGWLFSRRQDRTQGRLRPQRARELDALSMVWEPLEEDWKQGIATARAYRSAHGNLHVPTTLLTEDGFRLGSWIADRRDARKLGRLSNDRINQLDALNMVWDTNEEAWRHALAAARLYFNENGDLNVPRDFVAYDGFHLGQWLSNRRARRRRGRGKLSAERIAELDELGMVWDVHREAWQQGIAAARSYREMHGDLRVPAHFVTANGFGLGRWIAKRRSERARGTLAKERVDALDELGVVWEPIDEKWQTGIEAARAYREKNGDLRVPTKFVADGGFRLGTWLFSRRQDRTMGRLSRARIAELDAIGMTWTPRDDYWEKGVAKAQAFAQSHGHLDVKQKFVTDDGFRLGTWISARRRDRKLQRLSANRIAELDALGMAWSPRVGRRLQRGRTDGDT